MTALLQCNAANAGACDAELDVCRGASGVVAESPAPAQQGTFTQPANFQQPHSNANILPWLVGQWITANHQFTFWADGRVRRASGVPLIMAFPSSDGNHCGTKESTAALTVRYRIEWFDNPYDEDPKLQLKLRDIDCTKGDMYCVDGMNRR